MSQEHDMLDRHMHDEMGKKERQTPKNCQETLFYGYIWAIIGHTGHKGPQYMSHRCAFTMLAKHHTQKIDNS